MLYHSIPLLQVTLYAMPILLHCKIQSERKLQIWYVETFLFPIKNPKCSLEFSLRVQMTASGGLTNNAFTAKSYGAFHTRLG